MKKIKIDHFTLADKTRLLTVQRKHCVSLGNGLNVLFTNINDVYRMLAHCNAFLNEKLFELNELYIETRSNYQRLWFYFGHDTLNYENTIKHNFRLVEKNFEMLISRSSYGNGNQFVFTQLKAAAMALIETVIILQAVQKERFNYVERRCLEVMKKRLEKLVDELAAFGFNDYEHTPGENMGLLKF